MKRITVVCHIDNFTGYGQLAKAIIDGLTNAGYYVAIRCTFCDESPHLGGPVDVNYKVRFVKGPQPEPWEILIAPPFHVPTAGKNTIWITMWESTQLPTGSVHLLNRARVVVVPNSWNASCFSACGVNVPIRIMPLGINPDVFQYRPFQYGDLPFVFGAAGRWHHGAERKGIMEVVDLYEAVFGKGNPNVKLKVKVFKDCRPICDNPSIIIEDRFLSEHELAMWYTDIDCFVSLATAEGWGLHQHQAMATGRPLISVKYAGVAEYFNEFCGYALKYKVLPVKQPNRYRYSGCWAVPDHDDAINAMLTMCNRQLCEKLGTNAAKAVKRFTTENMISEFLKIINEFVEQ